MSQRGYKRCCDSITEWTVARCSHQCRQKRCTRQRYIVPSGIAPDGVKAAGWSRLLMSGYQEEIRPRMGDRDLRPHYEEELYRFYCDYCTQFDGNNSGDHLIPEYYANVKGWRQKYEGEPDDRQAVNELDEVGRRGPRTANDTDCDDTE